MSPGSLPAAPASPARGARRSAGPASIHAYQLRPTGLHGVPIDEAADLFDKGRIREDVEETIIWIDIVCPGAAEAELLRDRLGMHPLAVEDCLRGRQRPKLDRYPGYFFLVVYAAAMNEERGRTALEEMHLFVGERFIITVHDHKLTEVREVLAKWRTQEAVFPSVAHLAYALLDAVVDSYLPVVTSLGSVADELEQEVLTPGGRTQMQRILDLRRELAAIRHVLSPMRDVLRTLVRRDVPFLRPELVPYLQDVLDHAERGAEELEALREMLVTTLHAYLSLTANQLNETMRLMAAWSIILMAMAWVAGVYGMNFDRMPELHWPYGYLWALGLMLVMGGVLLVYFRRRSWL